MNIQPMTVPAPFTFDLTFSSDPAQVFLDKLVITASTTTGEFEGIYSEPNVFSAPIEGARMAADGTFSFAFDAQQGAEVIRCEVRGTATLMDGDLRIDHASKLTGDFFFVDGDGTAQHVGTFVSRPEA